MKTKTIKLSPEVRAVLESSTIAASTVVLTPGLDRALYLSVDKALRAAGGKWDKREKAHVFAGNAREALGLALATGEVVDRKAKKTAKSTEPVTLSLSCYYKQGDDLDNHYNVALEDKAGGCVEAAAMRAWAADLAASAKHLVTLAQLLEENSHTDPTLEAGTHMVELTVTSQLAAKIAALDLPIVSQPQRPSCQ